MSEQEEQQAAPGTSVAEYRETEAGLAELRSRLQNIVHDVRSPEGMSAARADRRECVRLRTMLEDKREELKAGVLARGRLIDGRAKEIRLAIEELEAPIDLQIKGEEQRKASEREERDRIERNRVAEIRAALDVIVRRPIDAIGLNVAALDKLIESMTAKPPDPAIFQELHPQAGVAYAQSLTAIRQARDRKANEEAESARLKQEREQFEAAKQEEEERQRKARQEAAQREQAEQEARDRERRDREAREAEEDRQRREARDRAFREAEEERQAAKELADAEAAAERAEADRIAREARELADRQAEAERQRKAEEARQAAAAEEQRLAAQRAEQERVAADLARAKAEAEAEIERKREEERAKNMARLRELTGTIDDFVAAAEQYREAEFPDSLGCLVKLCELYMNAIAAAVEAGRSQGRAALEEEYRNMTHATLTGPSLLPLRPSDIPDLEPRP